MTLVVYFLAMISLFAVIFGLVILLAVNKDLKKELKRKQEFIDKHLFVVSFPSQFYVFPYVWGTHQKEVFYLLSDPRSSKPLYETIGTDEARRRIIESHQARMEEMDRMGV